MQVPPGNPLLLSHTLQELLARDSVQVELIPEKKGLFLKHVEYEVSSQVTRGRAGWASGKGPGDGRALPGASPCILFFFVSPHLRILSTLLFRERKGGRGEGKRERP